MKVSENWLREWVNPPMESQQLASLLTMSGLEVDSVHPVAGSFEGVVVAAVQTVTAHPQADKLHLCEVSVGKEAPLKIVCGASNVRPGLKVALAQIGAKLPNGLVIKEAKLRGELSQGMLCSASELGLVESSEGILELDEDAPLGKNIRDYLLLNDQIFDVDLTPNRADCLSILGIAREVAALTSTPLKTRPDVQIPSESNVSKAVHLQASSACPLYCGRVIHQINSQAQTPLWMREKLRRAGVRSIHPVVDVTNYVMLELGQPMHAFDCTKIEGDIIVRFADNGEKLTLLDGQNITLKACHLVIADNCQPLAIAGVMGGLDSAVTETTTDVFLESAYFNPVAIAGVARSFGLFTDSSQRFERGVDPELPLIALDRATQLLIDIAGGTPGKPSIATDKKHLPVQKTILFHPQKVKRLTGLDIDQTTMLTLLQNLGLSIDQKESVWEVRVPSYRFDLALDVDLVEEILRIQGYDAIVGEPMIAALQAGAFNKEEALIQQASHFFIARGYHETISYSFVDPELQAVLYPDAASLSLLNPISPELSRMRAGLWSGLIAAMVHNFHRQQTVIKLFENGVAFDHKDGKIIETPCLGGLLSGELGSLNWSEEARKFDFFDLKGDLQAFFASLSLHNVVFKPAAHPALHPGKSAQIHLNNHFAGWCGVLHPRIAAALDVANEVLLFEAALAPLLSADQPRYHKISKFPQIRRDLSFLVDDKIMIADIQAVVEKIVPQTLLKSFDVFDVYVGKSIPEGKKSLAIAVTLQEENRTLVDQEINQIINAIIKQLGDNFAITLRD